jgi:hypothetical protein
MLTQDYTWVGVFSKLACTTITAVDSSVQFTSFTVRTEPAEAAMSNETTDFQPGRRLLNKKSLLIGGGVVLFLLFITWFIGTFFAVRSVPALGGGISISAAPGVKIYVGDKLMPNGNIWLNWAELLGDDGHERLAVDVGQDSNPLTAEALAGPGAQVLERTVQGGGRANVTLITAFQYLLRQADGMLDQVFVLQIDRSQPRDPSRRFLVLIRPREGKGDSSANLSAATTRISAISRAPLLKVLGLSATELNLHIAFSRATPPDEFAQEIKTKGLWEPPGE